MKKIIFLLWIFLLVPSITWAQERVEAPAWNVGDKWDFSKGGTAKVVGADQNSYIVEFSSCDSMFEKYVDKLIL